MASTLLPRRHGSDRTLIKVKEHGKAPSRAPLLCSAVNEHFTQAQKIHRVETLWQVAYSNAHLDAHENHLMRAKEVAGHA
jgi:uncharacterized tellurite resistance protein B-like protein